VPVHEWDVDAFDEILRVNLRGPFLLIVPHAWKTGISVAVASNLAMVTPHILFFEFLPAEPCESRLRKELTRDELVFSGGALQPPARPGLGIDLDRDALERFVEAARRHESQARS